MRELATLAAFYRPLHFARIDSTNDEAKRRAAAAAEEGTLVWADEQSAGRGRRGREWVSTPGNLHVSLILRPRCQALAAAQLGFVAALAVAEACARFLPQGPVPRCKWPNDVLIDGQKVAGLLLESSADAQGALAWLVLGIGVNLASHPAATEYPATSLAAWGAAVTPAAMLDVLAALFLAGYQSWRAEGFAPARAAWLARAFDGLGAPIRVRLAASEFSGRFAGLNEAGMLLLDGAGGRRTIAAAEIFPAA